MTPTEITIDGVIYRPVQQPSPIRIVIAQRGWVWVGRWHEEGDRVTLTDALNVRRRWGTTQGRRRWGTTQGLGQIAKDGPTGSTVLDPAGTVRLHVLGVVATLDCEEDKWASRL